jgi:hypothetical protein
MSDQTFKVCKNPNKQLIIKNNNKHQPDLRTQQYHIELN